MFFRVLLIFSNKHCTGPLLRQTSKSVHNWRTNLFSTTFWWCWSKRERTEIKKKCDSYWRVFVEHEPRQLITRGVHAEIFFKNEKNSIKKYIQIEPWMKFSARSQNVRRFRQSKNRFVMTANVFIRYCDEIFSVQKTSVCAFVISQSSTVIR